MSNLDLIFLVPKTIGPIQIGVELSEAHSDQLQITQHPVEDGAKITDHAIKLQPELTLKCNWSNAQIAALLGTQQQTFTGGELTRADYIGSIYSQLLALQEKRERFDVVTSMRIYHDMLFKTLTVTKEVTTGEALSINAVLTQIRVVRTQGTKLPPRENQAKPKSTAETTAAGTKAAIPSAPVPGGSVPLVSK